MDPLKPVFETYGWKLEQQDEKNLVFVQDTAAVHAVSHIQRDKVYEGDLCLSVCISQSAILRTNNSSDLVNQRLSMLSAASVRHFENDLFIKGLYTNWFHDQQMLLLKILTIWPGNSVMLAAPYELYMSGVGISYELQKSYLAQVMKTLPDQLTKPEDDTEANDAEFYDCMIADNFAQRAVNIDSPP